VAGAPEASANVHGTAIALGAHAALIRGSPGSGKSDLALRCLATAPTALIPVPAMLVADDRVDIARTGGRITVTAPATIRGRLEIRGQGIATVPHAESAELVLLVDLVSKESISRYPDPAPRAELLGLSLPLLALAPFEASAPVKLLMALAQALRTP
jgi:serine kinase of HPr protein (carbohydrate metabolism regulator)